MENVSSIDVNIGKFLRGEDFFNLRRQVFLLPPTAARSEDELPLGHRGHRHEEVLKGHDLLR